MERFYWVIENALAGCSRPGAHTAAGDALDADLAFLHQRGVSAVLSLTEEPLPPGALARAGLRYEHVPVPDMQALFPEETMTALTYIDSELHAGGTVAVHCLMGQGRTGSVLAAYLIRQGRSAQEAIDHLRSVCPGALASEAQVHALRAFARDRVWIV